MVQNSEWGPPLWRILHTLAERLGRQPNAMLQSDESRAWVQFLRLVEAIMPCALCRSHYRTWRTARPLEHFLELRYGPDVRAAARDWLWALHEDVNTRKGVAPDVRPALEGVEGIYGIGARDSRDLQQDIEVLVKILTQAAQERQIDGAYLRDWRAKLTLLRRLMAV